MIVAMTSFKVKIVCSEDANIPLARPITSSYKNSTCSPARLHNKIMYLLFKIIFLLLSCTSIAESADSIDPLGQFCNENANISNAGELSANIGQLLAELVQKTPSSGFFTTSYGKDQDQVYGLAQCRGDVSNQDCSICIKDAAKEIRQRCPDQVDARIWYDFCFLRYNNKAFTGEVDTSFGIFYFNVEK